MSVTLFNHRWNDIFPMTVTPRYPAPLLDELEHIASTPGARLREAWVLLRRGADVNAPNRDGRTALHQAVMTPAVTLPFLRAMLNAGANVNAITNEGYAPLHHAAARGDLARARLLIEAGADLNPNSDEVMGNGKTPLQTAVSHKHPDLVDLLIEAGADVNRLGWNHRLQFCHTFTAFHLAVQTDQVAVMERLLAAGANPDTPFLTTLTDGPLPVSRTEALLDLAHEAPQARAWLERRVLAALSDEPSVTPSAHSVASIRSPRRL